MSKIINLYGSEFLKFETIISFNKIELLLTSLVKVFFSFVF